MRRRPVQGRSRATVDAIVEAGAQVLGRRGWLRFTTNEVAEVAGVSIGSLYQYFPDKLALADAVRNRHFDAVSRAIAAFPAQASLEDQARALVEMLVLAHSGHPGLTRALLDEAPPPQHTDKTGFDDEYQGLFDRLVAAAPADRAASPHVASVLASAVEATIHDGAKRGILDDPAFRTEVVILIVSYIQSTPRTLQP